MAIADCRLSNVVWCDLVACRDVDGVPLKTIRLTPDGEVASKQGAFVVDEEAFELIEAAFEEHGTLIPVDYEHQTLGEEYAAPDGKAPAAGWIHAINYKKGEGIFAEVEWLAEAAEMIRKKQYLFLSPVLGLRKKDRKAVELHSAALTNKPAIPRMEKLAAKDKETDMPEVTQANQEGTEGGETTPDQLLGQIQQLLKQEGVALEPGASRDAVLQAVITLLEGGSSKTEGEGGGENEEVAASVRTELGLKETAGKDEVLVALSSLKQRAGADTEVAKLRGELEAMKGREADRMAKELVDADIAANKVNPNDKQHVERCLAFAKKDAEGYRAFMAGVEPSIEPGRTEPPNGRPAGGGASAEEDKLIEAAMTEHKGNTKRAHIALQSELLDRECAVTGYTRKKAAEVLSQRYPKIFA